MPGFILWRSNLVLQSRKKDIKKEKKHPGGNGCASKSSIKK
jgi:hypothetical protein